MQSVHSFFFRRSNDSCAFIAEGSFRDLGLLNESKLCSEKPPLCWRRRRCHDSLYGDSRCPDSEHRLRRYDVSELEFYAVGAPAI